MVSPLCQSWLRKMRRGLRACRRLWSLRLLTSRRDDNTTETQPSLAFRLGCFCFASTVDHRSPTDGLLKQQTCCR